MEIFDRKKVLLLVAFNCWLHFLQIECATDDLRNSFPKKLYNNPEGISKNVSKVLSQLLRGYDKRIRPNYAGPPVLVGITININNINSVSEVNMDYSLDIFFRQLWVDKRLSFDLSADGINELVIGADMLHRIWLPDTFIANDKKTYFHKATVQNKFIRINPDGQVLYSMRMTVTAACPMNFQYFPMDHQVCDLEIESYGFRMDDIKYKWGDGLNNASALHISPDIELPQLKYKDSRLIEREFRLSTGLYSRLTMKLYFVRSLGYYIIQIYLPSSLIVVLSWVSFWLDISAAPARITLGMTTVLTMVTFIWSTNASLPKISYVKGIDVYLVMCFIMTFSSVIEYAIVSFVYNKVEKKKKEKLAAIQRADKEKEATASAVNNTQKILLMKNNSHSNGNNIYSMSHSLSNSSAKGLDKSDRGLNQYDYDNQSPYFMHRKEEHVIDNKSLPILVEKKCRCSDCSQQSAIEKAIQINNSIKRSSSITNKNLSTESIIHYKPGHYNYSDKHANLSSPIHSEMPYRISALTQPKKKHLTHRKILCCMVEMRAVTIDKYARATFPIIFTTFHVIYWTVYLTISSSLWYIDSAH